MDAVSVIALSMGAAWASGINLYATLFMLGYMSTTGNITLPAELEVVANPMVMTAAGFMYCVEFFADKIPGVDTAWDSIHTFIRIPAGAMLASSAVGDVTPAIELTTALLGGLLAAGTHTTKAGTRLLINTSPEPVSNWTASIAEDLIVIGGLWAALNHPLLFIIGLIAFIIFMIWALPRLWRLLKLIFRKVGSWLGFCDAPSPAEVQSTSLSAVRDEQFKP
jgi:hypothetical protein